MARGSFSARAAIGAAALLGVVAACPPGALAAPPANDNFASAQPLSPAAGLPASATGTTVDATREAGEPVHAASAGARSAWFTWTAPSSRRVRLSACGSAFNTLLAVYTGGAVGSLTRVADNNDSSACATGTRSSVDFNATGGQTYRIAVDGKSGASGAVSLAITDVGPHPPANDDFANAAATLPADALPATAAGTTAGATAQTGEPSHEGRRATRSVWYSWTAPESGTVRIQTCGSGTDARPAVYTGSAVNALTRVSVQSASCDNGLARALTFDAAAGQTYRIAVDSAGTGGTFLLNVGVAPRITIADTTVTEGDAGSTQAVFTATLSRPWPDPVTVAYRTTTDLDESGWRHFEPAAGLLEFAPAQTTATFGVRVNGDITDEGDQQVRVELLTPVGATLADTAAIATILDDDGPAPDGWECGPLECLVPGEGPVRMSRSPDHSELLRTIAISRRPRPRTVMHLEPGRLGPVGRGDLVEASGEVEVSVTCLEAMEKCIGKRYRYSPKVRGTLVLRGDGFQQRISRESLTCSQRLPHRNHHCVMVFAPRAAKAPGVCGGCRVELRLSAAHPAARPGNRLVIGADSDGGVAQDKGRLQAAVIEAGAPKPEVVRTRERARKALPVGPRTSGGQKLVVYSHRLDDLEAHEQVAVDARALLRTRHLNYGTFFGSEVVVSGSPDGIRPSSGIAAEGSAVTEKNGFNCTRGSSAHDNPCTIRKFGYFRVERDADGPVYVNLVVSAAARFGGNWNGSHRAKVLPKGSVTTKRYGPTGWGRLAVPP
jgi:hypothetical protein